MARVLPEPDDEVLEVLGAQEAEPQPAASPANGLGQVGRSLMTAAAFVIVVAGMSLSSALLVPFLVAVFIAVILAPVFLGMQRRGVPSGIALLILVAALVGVGAIAVNGIDRSLAGFTDNFQKYQSRFDQQIGVLLAWLNDHGIATPAEVRELLDPQALVRYIGSIAGALGSVVITAFIILIVAIFILLEAAALPAKVRGLPGLSRESWDRIQQIVADVRRYMFLKTVMSILTGALVAVFAWVMGIDFPILLGVLAFALNYVPNIGSFVAAIPGVLLAFVEFGLGTAVITAVGYVVINVGVSNGVEPRYMGHDLGLSPMIVLASVIFWGWVLGPLGMLLSVPLTMTLKIVFESDEDSRWIAHLMGAKPAKRLGSARFRR